MLDSEDLPSLGLPSVDTGASVVTQSLPSLDVGFRHPCRNDGIPTLVNNDESGSLGASKPRFHGRQGSAAGAGSAIWIPAIPAGMTAVSTTLHSQGE